MSFLAALERLDALGLELATPRRKFDLDHMRILARALGDPQTTFPSVLIAGTNGKGSTAATLASILAAAGLRTGLYTSPHLTRVTERIRVSTDLGRETTVILSEARSAESKDLPLPRPTTTARTFLPQDSNLDPRTSNLAEISEDSFARLYFHVDTTAARLVAAGQLPHPPSYFETLTALAFLYFAEQRLDIAVLEVGLGGRLDATNIVQPLLSVITDIALDHQEYLGSTLAEIAREKAGILRPNGTLITLPQHPEANRAIGEAAIALNVRAISATPYLPDARVPHREAMARPERSRRDQREPRERLSWGLSLPPYPDAPLSLNHYTLHLGAETLHVHSPLPGSHQQRNIALAIAAALELLIPTLEPGAPSKLRLGGIPAINLLIPAPEPGAPSKLRLGGIPATNLPIAALERGIAATHWPGRLEFLPPNLLLDVAHNPAGAWTLRAAIAQLPDTTPRTLIFSCLRDKDLREMSQILFPLFDPPTAPQPPVILSEARSAESKDPEASVTAPAPETFQPAGAALPDPPHSASSPARYNLILTPIDSPRAASLDALIAAARALSVPFHAATSPADALALARSLTPPPGLILATGSVYLIGALRTLALPSHT